MTDNTVPRKDVAGVMAPPPLLVLSVVLCAELLRWFVPVSTPSLGAVWRTTLAVAVGSTALALVASALYVMRRVRTPVEPWKPTRSIVTSGPYRFTRNPIYLAFLGLQLSYAWGRDNVWGILLLPLTIALLQWGVIQREERYLTRKFGEEYSRYRERVRRWI